jgi:hypothetical protein
MSPHSFFLEYGGTISFFRMWQNLYHSTVCCILPDTIVVEFIGLLRVGGGFQIKFTKFDASMATRFTNLNFYQNILSLYTFSP